MRGMPSRQLMHPITTSFLSKERVNSFRKKYDQLCLFCIIVGLLLRASRLRPV
ncbi:MAG: hypothetical protein JWR77_751, partial [Rhizorhabdus sp.]|nr:hypothetical protein [Rhizorhabdus sp.]